VANTLAISAGEFSSVDDSEVRRVIKGHDGLPGGSANPSKRCPGLLLPMNPLRADVADVVKDGARQRLYEAGLVFTKAA
jgi:hypothetical protein